jgi:hypothetical protein
LRGIAGAETDHSIREDFFNNNIELFIILIMIGNFQLRHPAETAVQAAASLPVQKL